MIWAVRSCEDDANVYDDSVAETTQTELIGAGWTNALDTRFFE